MLVCVCVRDIYIIDLNKYIEIIHELHTEGGLDDDAKCVLFLIPITKNLGAFTFVYPA